jgi:pimeloyl-ACP methyl ester carboxylesterase
VTAIRPAPIHVPDAALDDLKRRLAATRWPEAATVPDWRQGVPLNAAQALCDYWRNGYDWRRCEAMLNSWSPGATNIDGLNIHCFDIRSPEPGALPVVMTHGWPGSVLEFHKVIGPLTDPARHGGDPADAMHLVLPSLPGYGFSGRPAADGWTVTRIARAWAELMQRLGHGAEWAAQGGDWGAAISSTIAGQAPAGCIGAHFNFMRVAPSAAEIADANEEEQHALAQARHYDQELAGYKTEQNTRPQTLGYALADSPSGQAAWIYEKFHDWTDHAGTPESVLGRDEMLDIISSYWLTNTAASSARLYWEAHHAQDGWTAEVALPTAFSLFPKDIVGTSQRWASKRFSNIVYWGTPVQGGHFAALEQPEMFVEEVRNGMRKIRAAHRAKQAGQG